MKNDVSLWLGCFNDKEEFEKYTAIKYSEGGDSIPSIFEQDFKLGYYNRDLIEKDWIRKKHHTDKKNRYDTIEGQTYARLNINCICLPIFRL